jgi:hypothetical protein
VTGELEKARFCWKKVIAKIHRILIEKGQKI